MKPSHINIALMIFILLLIAGIQKNHSDIKQLAKENKATAIRLSKIKRKIEFLETDAKYTNTRIETLETEILSYDLRDKKIKIAKAIRHTMPSKNPFEGCRKTLTPSMIHIIANTLVETCNKYDVSYALILGIMRQESLFCQEAVSPAGAQGIMQIMPQTAIEQAKEIYKESGYSPQMWKLEDNILIGIYYISKRLNDFNGNEELALKAYNSGIHHVNKVLAGEQKDFYRESNKYADSVLKFKKEYQEMGIQ